MCDPFLTNEDVMLLSDIQWKLNEAIRLAQVNRDFLPSSSDGAFAVHWPTRVERMEDEDYGRVTGPSVSVWASAFGQSQHWFDSILEASFTVDSWYKSETETYYKNENDDAARDSRKLMEV